MSNEAQTQSEEAYLASYNPLDYPPIAACVDVLALTIRDRKLCVLLIERDRQPAKGCWALPGGFINADDPADPAEVAARVLALKTGLGRVSKATFGRVHLEQLGTYGAAHRDPRMRVISIAYLAFAPDLPDPETGDYGVAAWVPVTELGLPEVLGDRDVTQAPGTSKKLAFDHAQIIADGIERARSKLEYTPLGCAFVNEPFTVGELRSVYESVWGEPLHASNFHRKVLSVPGLVTAVEGKDSTRANPRGGPKARLYRRGDARLLHPALLRPAREDDIR